MAIDSKHPEYEKRLRQWVKCRDVLEGEDAVKAAGDKYLPKLDDQGSSSYTAYKARAMFFEGAGRTVVGLTGAVFRKKPEIEFPKAHEDKLSKIGITGASLETFAKEATGDVIGVGRFGILVDMAENGDEVPYFVGYKAESIINWRTAVVNGSEQLTMVVLEEEVYVEDVTDKFVLVKAKQYRLLELVDVDGAMRYRVSVSKKVKQANGMDDTFQEVSAAFPEVKGKPIDYIPFVIMNGDKVGAMPERPPILGMVNVSLSHYRTSADLEHGRHFTALPTAWVAGFDVKSTKLYVGSQVAWVSDDPQAHAGYLEFTGQGLGHLAGGLRDKEGLMAVLGARLLEEQRKGIEAAETHKLRQSGENSALTNLALSVSGGVQQALVWFNRWLGGNDEDKIVFKLNTDYTAFGIDAQQLVALMGYYQSGALSYDSLFKLLQKSEIIPDGRTMEEELSFIDTEPPKMMGGAMDLSTPTDGGSIDGGPKPTDGSADQGA